MCTYICIYIYIFTFLNMYLYLNLKHHKCICSAPYLDSTGTFNQNNKQKQQNRIFWSPADHYRYRWWWLVTTGPISPGSGFRLFIDARNKAAVRMSLSVSDLKTTQDTDELPRHERHDEHIAPLWVLMKSQGSEFGMYYRAPEPRWWCTVWESCSITGCDWSSMSVCVCVCYSKLRPSCVLRSSFYLPCQLTDASPSVTCSSAPCWTSAPGLLKKYNYLAVMLSVLDVKH